VTDPLKPKGLWEFKVRPSGACTSAVGDTDDCDLGFSYGNPILTKITKADATTQWVVMVPSGYNNVSPGDGKGYLYLLNPATGVLIKKIALCSAAPQSPSICPGSTGTPMGFAKINNWVDDSNVNNTTLRVYGGDLLGNVWRINTDAGTAYVIAQLNDGAATPVGQPVTTKPELGQVTGSSGTADMVYLATGKYLGTGDTSTTQKQTIYAIKDATNGTAPVTPIDARGSTVKAQTLTDTTDATGAAIRTITNNPVGVTGAGIDGWRVDLPVSGERVNVDMKLQLGTLIVGSNVPSRNSCNSGGFSFLNFLDYRTGSYIPSSTGNIAGQRVGNSLLVGINVVRLPNNKTVAIATTSDNQHPTLYPPFQSPNPVGRRVGWREISE
jgi:type IV pilus assembly protein PilY1